MVAFILIIIAIILFFIAKSLHESADRSEYKSYGLNKTPVQSITTSQNTIVTPIKSYWEIWKENNPHNAHAIESQLDRDMAQLTDKEVKDIIGSFSRLSKSNNNPNWHDIKKDTIEMLSHMVESLGEETVYGLLSQGITDEMLNFNLKKENTSLYISECWLKDFLSKAKQLSSTSTFNSKPVKSCSYLNSIKSAGKVYSDIEKQEIVDLFLKEYNEQILTKLGDNINNPFFCHGYNSPVSQEIMKVMYYYYKNEDFINKANEDGIWDKLRFLILEETNKLTNKICDADVQECIEYYNFPNKPVITSRRCPSCGNRDVHCEDIGLYECYQCGNMWSALHGRNLYLNL